MLPHDNRLSMPKSSYTVYFQSRSLHWLFFHYQVIDAALKVTNKNFIQKKKKWSNDGVMCWMIQIPREMPHIAAPNPFKKLTFAKPSAAVCSKKVRAAVRGPKVPWNTIKPCVDIVHFLITMEFWNRTPAHRGTWCATNRYEPTHLDKQPEERWLYKCQACKQALTPNHSKASPMPPRPQPFQSLGDTALSVRWSSNSRDNNEYLSRRLKAPTQRKAFFSRNVLSTNDCNITFHLFPPEEGKGTGLLSPTWKC